MTFSDEWRRLDEASENQDAPSPALTAGALRGLKVVDASRILGGPLCAQILGDHGADVIKIEGPDGDDTRRWGPPFSDGVSAYFSGLNRNKRALCLDLTDAQGRQHLFEMLATADVLIENFKPGTVERWGLSSTALRERFPALIHCRVSGFGPDGPMGGLPAYDTAMQGLCGLMSVNGDAHTGPLRVGLPVVDMTTALNAVIGVLLALQERHRSGRGQLVEATLYDSALSLLHPHAANYLMTGQRPVATGNAHPSIYPYDSFLTKHGSIYLAVGNDRQFERLCECLGTPDLARDARFGSNASRSTNRSALRRELETKLADVDGPALCAKLVASGVPSAPIVNVDEALSHAHAAHRSRIVSVGGGYRGIASPIHLERTPATYRLAPPALPGSGKKSMADPENHNPTGST